MPVTLKDRVAIVTGGGGGLGREYAIALAKAGVKVVVNDYGGDMQGKAGDVSRAQGVVNEITSFGGSAVADGGDVARDAKSIVATALSSFGRLDIVINNAGVIGKISPHDDIDVENFRRVYEISALGTAMMTSAAYPTMQSQGHGRIINVSSNAVMGLEAGGDCAYSAAKGAVFAMTREMGRFATRHGIKVNGILPAGSSRLADQTEAVKILTRKYFPGAKIAPFVLLLASDECPVSGELFSTGGGRAARVTLSTFPGSNQSTSEDWLEDWSNVMGKADDIYIPKNTADEAVYMIKQATGDDLAEMEDFGMDINGGK